MGAGDRFMQKSFSVAMPAGVDAWPFPRNEAAWCPLCDRRLSFCDCHMIQLTTEQGEGD